MPITLEDLDKQITLDIEDQILKLFVKHLGSALTFDEIAKSFFDEFTIPANSGLKTFSKIAFFLTIENVRLKGMTFIPTAETGKYISVLMSTADERNKVIRVLEYYSSMNEKVWNSL